MPIIGLSLSTNRAYQSKFDSAKGTPEATEFLLGTLDSRISGWIRDKATTMIMDADPAKSNDEVRTEINSSAASFLTVQYALRGWTNFRDKDGNDIPFKTVKRNQGGQSYTVVDPEVLKSVPEVVLNELAAEVRRDNELSEIETKN